MNVWMILGLMGLTFVLAIDQFNLTEVVYQPLVAGPLAGLILGEVEAGFVVGAAYQLVTLGSLPIGGAQPPNALMGTLVSLLWVKAGLQASPLAALILAYPWAMAGQAAVKYLFERNNQTVNRAVEAIAHNQPERALRLHAWAVIRLGLVFGSLVGGSALVILSAGPWLLAMLPPWVISGLALGGEMLRWLGVATLLTMMRDKKAILWIGVGFGLTWMFASWLAPQWLVPLVTLVGAVLVISQRSNPDAPLAQDEDL